MLLLYAQYLSDVFMLSSIYGTPDRKTMTAVVAAATTAGDDGLVVRSMDDALLWIQT